MRIANDHTLPLYPISTGKNLGYGGSAPILSGSVVVDLKRMNRIINVDEGRCSAIVEPGVSYFDLYRYIQERGFKLWIDTPDPGWGSVVGNAPRACGTVIVTRLVLTRSSQRSAADRWLSTACAPPARTAAM